MSTQSETLKCMAMRFTTDHVLVFTVGHLDMLYCVMSVGQSVGYYGNAVSPIVPNRALHPKSHATQGSTAVSHSLTSHRTVASHILRTRRLCPSGAFVIIHASSARPERLCDALRDCTIRYVRFSDEFPVTAE
jgi:hypothetical protein